MTEATMTSSINRRTFLAGGLMTITNIITLKGEPLVWPRNRWYGLLTPGRDLSAFFDLTGQLAAAPSTAGYFIKLNSNFTPLTLARFGDRGLTPFLTFEPRLWQMQQGDLFPAYNLSTFLSGAYDDDLRRIAQVIADYDKPVYLRLAHEMNGHWYPWAVGVNGNTATQYVDFWKHVRDVFQIAPKIRWVWACAGIHGLRITAPSIDNLYPGDQFVDLAGTTGYAWDVNAERTYGPTFTRLANLSDRPFVIPEMGASTGPNQAGTPGPQWVESFGYYLANTPRIRGFVWFNINPAMGATGDYRLSGTDMVSSLNTVLTTVPITSNTRMTRLDGTQTDTPPAQQVNPTTEAYAENVVNGTYCDPKGQTRGFDKYGNAYECAVHSSGWTRWRRTNT